MLGPAKRVKAKIYSRCRHEISGAPVLSPGGERVAVSVRNNRLVHQLLRQQTATAVVQQASSAVVQQEALHHGGVRFDLSQEEAKR